MEGGKPELLSLGTDIRGMRKALGMTLKILAAKSDTSVGFLSLVERGLKRPSVGTLQRVSEALGTEAGWFHEPSTSDEAEERRYVVRHEGQKRLAYTKFRSTDYLGMVDELLTPSLNAGMALVRTTLAPGASTGDELYAHDGEETGVVIFGELTLHIGKKKFVLQAGDSFGFGSDKPHRYSNDSAGETVIVMALAPIAFRY